MKRVQESRFVLGRVICGWVKGKQRCVKIDKKRRRHATGGRGPHAIAMDH